MTIEREHVAWTAPVYGGAPRRDDVARSFEAFLFVTHEGPCFLLTPFGAAKIHRMCKRNAADVKPAVPLPRVNKAIAAG